MKRKLEEKKSAPHVGSIGQEKMMRCAVSLRERGKAEIM
jgi:hypothetical protein